jgi:hypothetical protein
MNDVFMVAASASRQTFAVICMFCPTIYYPVFFFFFSLGMRHFSSSLAPQPTA